jgi:hypothetical protein
MAKVKGMKKVKPKREKPEKNLNKKVVRDAKEKPPIKPNQITELIAETLQANSEGEYRLPSFLMRYTSGPKTELGWHLEYYIPIITKAPYYAVDSPQAMDIFRNQAWQITNELMTNQFPIRDHNNTLPLCKDCK